MGDEIESREFEGSGEAALLPQSERQHLVGVVTRVDNISRWVFGGAFLTAAVWLACFLAQLPPEEGFRDTLTGWLWSLPLLMVYATPIAIVSALPFLPIARRALRLARIGPSVSWVLALVAIESLLITPIHPLLSFLALYPTAVIGLLTSSRLFPRSQEPDGREG